MITRRNRTLAPLSLALGAAVIAFGSAQVAQGVVIASQDFEGNTLSRGIPDETNAVLLGFYNDVTGIYTMPGLSWDSGTGLPFTHSTDAPTPEGVTPIRSPNRASRTIPAATAVPWPMVYSAAASIA